MADATDTQETATTTDEDPTPPKSKDAAKGDLVSTFLKLSGYKKDDVIGHHDGRRTVVTSNGGKYEVSPKGKRLRTLSGPSTPKELEATAEEDDE